MPTFKAANQVDFLLPATSKAHHRIEKLDKLPSDYEELPWFHERTDLREPNGHLEVQDRVILVVERAGWHDIYKVSCRRG